LIRFSACPRAQQSVSQMCPAEPWVSDVTTQRMSMPGVLASIRAATRRWQFQLLAP
jgi:hypothetical protein